MKRAQPIRRSIVLAALCAGCSASGSSTGQAASDAGLADTDRDSGSLSATDASTVDSDSGAEGEGGIDPSAPDALTHSDAAPDIMSPAGPTAFVTSPDLSRALTAIAVATGGGSAPTLGTVTIDPTKKFQSILGFGASITDSSSDVLTKYLSTTALHATLVKLFDPTQGIGLSLLRQPMGASDFSTVGDFSYDDGDADPTMSHFNIDQDSKATIPVLQQVLGINSGVFILATPWSAPAWMKLNGSMDGTGSAPGNSGLSGGDYQPFADYFVKFVQAYAAQGITVNAVTPQNEPLNGSSTYPGMDLGATWELQLIAQNLGPALAAASLSTQIWAYDHNWDQESYPETIMADATGGGFTEGAAFHCYGGDVSAMTTFHTHYPGKSVYMTECSGGDWQSDPWGDTIDLVIDSTANWARAVSLWNMALDENKGPQNRGCNDCRGVVTVDSGSGAVTYNVDYYALGHFSKFVARGAVRVGSSATGSVNQVAFANPDGSFALVAHDTTGSGGSLDVTSGAATMRVTLPAGGAVTLVWR